MENIKKQVQEYGSWKSPITSDLIVAGTIGLAEPRFDNDNIYWLEKRPTEGGRNVIVKLSAKGVIKDITPQPFNVRNRVHEYGGGAFLVVEDKIFFSNYQDQRIYFQEENTIPQPLTKESKQCFAEFIFDAKRQRLICVCEDHTNPNQEAENSLVSVDINTGIVTTLVSGNDFYAAPVLSDNGQSLAWVSWNHPSMPWDNTQLWLGEFDAEGNLGKMRLVAGENESICQPKFAPDNTLYFSSDKSNWWNLYCYHEDEKIEAICPKNAEFGFPHWVFGESIYGFLDAENIVCTYSENGSWWLGKINIKTKELTNLKSDFSYIAYLQVQGEEVVFLGASPVQAGGIVKWNLRENSGQILRQSSSLVINSGYISQPEAIAFPTENGLMAYAWYYPPTNKDYEAPENSLPPLLVKSHGGPTAASPATLNLKVQYWTSRGFAFIDVNYGGSTGYGREYRQRLYKNWGIVDVNDCINVAKYLVKQGKVDPEKLAIAGGSAGGYTTLAALTFGDTFKAGASYYGVSNLETLATDTHKFEARYLDNLIGKYPEEKEIYQRRSPINYTDKLSCPIIFFQGLEDKVVPPNQTETMVQALEKKGLPVAYVPFEGEQHGFRKAENIKKALDSEFYFYSQIFGFQPADNMEKVTIKKSLKT
jgi:dipeptidyl aminopeptidase/acylaminoacyl peptidase